jgi:hypothetical protein
MLQILWRLVLNCATDKQWSLEVRYLDTNGFSSIRLPIQGMKRPYSNAVEHKMFFILSITAVVVFLIHELVQELCYND